MTASIEVVYHGAYKPLDGVRMSEAYRSVVHLSFDVRAGLVMRQIHHWAALVFLAAIVAHLCRIFFTGAFRKPREINWIVGVTLLLLALANGFAGYSLPDDLLSGTGLRVANAFMLSIPIVGPHIAFFAFDGEFPGTSIISRLYIIHVLLIPLAIFAVAQRAPRDPLAPEAHPVHGSRPAGAQRRRLAPVADVRGEVDRPVRADRVAVLSALGGLLQINPIWLYGPYHPAAVSTAAQPDWYLGWAEGATPASSPRGTSTSAATACPRCSGRRSRCRRSRSCCLYAWPFLEARFTHDHDEHHLLDRPRDRPARTAIGVGVLTFYVMLLVAGGQDLFAEWFKVSIISVTRTLQLLVFVVPLAAALFTLRVCRDLAAARPRPGHTDPFASEPADDPAGDRSSPLDATHEHQDSTATGCRRAAARGVRRAAELALIFGLGAWKRRRDRRRAHG